ncbi:hypothetical protein DFH08DRAFT_951155 [Mycena albidolilacea]|uniref:Uncharacterized protein n=1 Tax=Mycena albidolilacea TaxID=1033008 RepID=A0AAD7AMM6_9AGAR|nr:hypothetical protein DFH08DRAFT_951155 [Mycena albidolilacea]
MTATLKKVSAIPSTIVSVFALVLSALAYVLQALFPATEPYTTAALVWLGAAAARGLTAFLLSISLAMLAVLVRNAHERLTGRPYRAAAHGAVHFFYFHISGAHPIYTPPLAPRRTSVPKHTSSPGRTSWCPRDGGIVRGWVMGWGVVWVRGGRALELVLALARREQLNRYYSCTSIFIGHRFFFRYAPAFDALQSRQPSCDCGPIPVRLS